MMDDTDPRALEILTELERNMSPGRKAALALAMSRVILRAAAAGVRMRYPNADEHEVLVRTAALHLDRELMIRAYGWDPEEHD
jgi:hypothetical protein